MHLGRALGGLAVAVVLVGCSSSPVPPASATPGESGSSAEPSSSATGSIGPGGSVDVSAPPSASSSGPGRIVFLRFEASSGHERLYTIAPDGSDLRPLLPGYPIGFSLPRWNAAADLVGAVSGDHPDGTIPLNGDDPAGFETTVQPDGSHHVHLQPPDPGIRLVCAAWTASGADLLCEGWSDSKASLAGVYSVSSTGSGGLKQLTQAGTFHDVPGDDSADGTQFAFVRTSYSVLGLGEIWIANADGTNAHKVTDTLTTYRIGWSRDGRWIVGERDGVLEVFDLQNLTADPEKIAVPGGTATEPRWSPDASRIVFVYTKAGAKTSEIESVARDGTDLVQITSGNLDRSPDWGSPGF